MKTFYSYLLISFLVVFGSSSYSQCLFADLGEDFLNHNGHRESDGITFGNFYDKEYNTYIYSD